MIFYLITLIASENILHETPGEYSFSLKPGQYTVHCYGAQGGDHYRNGEIKSGYGGMGAYTKGVMTVTGTGTQFHAIVGGKGSSGRAGPNDGGYNNGGKGGKDLEGFFDKSQDDAPGGGGGSTDLFIHDKQLSSRIMVAAGGSSGAGVCRGSNGGLHKMICPIKNDVFRESDQEGNEDGKGGDGEENGYQPGGGGGGGYKGGLKGVGSRYDNDNYRSVGCGGTSYISGDDYYEVNEKMVFKLFEMKTGAREGNGSIEIVFDFVCEDGCASCKSESVCVECFEGFLFEGKCGSSCPEGYFEKEHSCVKCDEKCKTCQSSSSNCLSCVDGFNLLDNDCVVECPPGKTSVLGKCLPCNEPCKTCSSSQSTCTSCVENYVMYNNKCVLDCPKGTIKTDFTCEKCKPFCDECIDSTVKCTSCKNGYFLLNNQCVASCPDKMFPSGSECIQCKDPCSSCSSENDCLTCKNGFFLYENRCHESCPDGTSPYGVGCMKNQ